MPNQRVVAICVVQDGQQTLDRTLSALQAQHRQIDTLVVVDLTSSDDSAAHISAAKPDSIFVLPRNTSFGQAIDHAVAAYTQQHIETLGEAAAQESLESVWFWLLSQDNVPDEGALRSMLREAELSPSVAIVGPKLVRSQDADQLVEFGQTLTTSGTTVHLSAGQFDQGQFDKRSDVMGVAAAGLLIQASVWADLDGLNPALPNVDGGLDLSIRARLMGHRVVVAPDARVEYRRRFSLLSPEVNTSQAIRHAQLTRRLSYASVALLPFMWLALLPEAFIRSLVLLLNKQPGRVLPELIATLSVMFNFGALATSRKLFHSQKKHPLRSLDLLRRSMAENRRLNQTDDESSSRAEPVQFFFGGGGLVSLILLGIGIIAFGSFWGAGHLFGGGTSPLAPIGELWQNAVWRPGLFDNPSDPFQTVLALLGSLTFWNTSHSLILLYLIALPLAGAGAWFFAARLGAGQLTRALVAVLWALAPMHLIALADGRISAIIFHLVLPWLALAARHSARNWTAAGLASLLFFVAAAAQPAMLPILLVIWVFLFGLNIKYYFRLIVIPLPALIFFTPLAIARFIEGNPFAILIEPGMRVPYKQSKVWELALGMPEAGLGGWTNWLDFLNNPVFISALILAIALATVGLSAVFALATKRFLQASVGLFIALIGFGWAVLLGHIEVSQGGALAGGIWPGGALSLYWLGLLIAVTAAFQTGRVGALQGLSVIAVTAAMLPLLTATLFGNALVKPNARTLPALVTAVADEEPHVGTLDIRPQKDGAIVVSVQRGSGDRLDQTSTLSPTGSIADYILDQQEINQIAVNLLSGVTDGTDRLAEAGIHYVLLRPIVTASKGFALGNTSVTEDATAIREQYLVGLGSVFELSQIGDTSEGKLWGLDKEMVDISTIPSPPPSEKIAGADKNFAFALIGVLVLAGIFSIPTRRLTPLGTAASRREKSSDQELLLALEATSFQQVDDSGMNPESVDGEGILAGANTGEISLPDVKNRFQKKDVIQGVSRSLLAVTALGAVAVTIIGSGIIAWPVIGLQPASANAIQPVSAAGQLVCPGSFLTSRLIDGQQGFVSHGDSVQVQTSAGEKSTTTKLDGSSLPGNPAIAVSPHPDSVGEAAASSGAIVQLLNNDRARGISAEACISPSTEGWLMAGTLDLGHSPLTYLINPNPVPVTLEMIYYSENGRQSSHQVSIPAHSQIIGSVAGYIPDARLAAVQFLSSGGPVVAYLADTLSRGLDSGGVDLVSAASAPATSQIFPTVQLRNQEPFLAIGIHQGMREVFPTVRLLNPGTEVIDVEVTITLQSNSSGETVVNPGITEQTVETRLSPELVHEMAFEGLADGDYQVTVNADGPVLATFRTTVMTQTGDDPDDDAFRSDIDWINSAAPHTGNVFVSVPAGPNPMLGAFNGSDETVQITVAGVGDVTLLAGEAKNISVQAGVLEVDGLLRTSLSLNYHSALGVATFSIPAIRPPGESIWVY